MNRKTWVFAKDYTISITEHAPGIWYVSGATLTLGPYQNKAVCMIEARKLRLRMIESLTELELEWPDD